MGLFKVVKTDSFAVYVWKIEESIEELYRGLQFRAATQQRLEGMRSDTHKKGFLAIRHLLLEAGTSDLDLLYDLNGKPYLEDGRHISISHSFDYACIIVSKYNVGIDIEQKRDKIQRIANKFLSVSEVEFNTALGITESVNYLTRVWCVKEVLFKMCNSRSLSFKDNMNVTLTSYDSAEGLACVCQGDFNLTVCCTIFEFDNFILAYSIEL